MTKSQKTLNPLETDPKFSTAYTLAFGKETSKYNIQKFLTESGRHTTIIDKYKQYFEITKRTDKRMGYLIKSKPELLIDYIANKTYLDPITKSNLKKLFTNKFIVKIINKTLYKAAKTGYRPINHNLIIRYLTVLLIGKYITGEYQKFFKPKGTTEEFLKIYNELDKQFLPKLYSKEDRHTKHNKNTLEMNKIINSFNLETMEKIIRLHPDHKVILRAAKSGLLIAKSLSDIDKKS